MSQKKLSKVIFYVDGLYTAGHARRCETMVRNSAGGIESVKADEIAATLELVFDKKHQTLHSIKDIVDETGYLVTGEKK